MPGPSLRSENVRFDESAERRGEAVTDLLATACGLEFVDVEIHGDRRTSVAHLPLDSHGVEAAFGEVRAIGEDTAMPANTTIPSEVLAMKEARESLPGLNRCFVEKGAAADPVYFGAHRRPTGVMLSYQRYLGLLHLVDDLVAALDVRRRDATDTGERMTLEELISDQGFDPAELGLTDE